MNCSTKIIPKKWSKKKKIPLLKPPNSPSLYENLEVLATSQQAPTTCQAEIDYKEIHTNFPEQKHEKVPKKKFNWTKNSKIRPTWRGQNGGRIWSSKIYPGISQVLKEHQIACNNIWPSIWLDGANGSM